MSLLLDALKRAEAAKKQKQQAAQGGAEPSLALEPNAVAASAAAEPDLALNPVSVSASEAEAEAKTDETPTPDDLEGWSDWPSLHHEPDVEPASLAPTPSEPADRNLAAPQATAPEPSLTLAPNLNAEPAAELQLEPVLSPAPAPAEPLSLNFNADPPPALAAPRSEPEPVPPASAPAPAVDHALDGLKAELSQSLSKPAAAEASASASALSLEPDARSRAQQVRQAQQSAKPARARWSNTTRLLLLLVSVVLGMAAYFWWALRPHPVVDAGAESPPEAVNTPAPETAAPSAGATKASPDASGLTTIPMTDGGEAKVVKQPPAGSGLAPVPPAPATAPVAAAAPAAPASTATPVPEAEPWMKIEKQPKSTAVPAMLQQAWLALHQGQTRSAVTAYQQVLAEDPEQIDAWLGLAAAWRVLGQTGPATQAYREVLAREPENEAARVGLARLQHALAPAQAEADLKAALVSRPQSDALHASLGRLYAQQGRWQEAEAAFFQALSLAPQVPAHAYNLAVSLDHLGQTEAALQQYQQALQAVAGREAQAGFDVNAARERLASERLARGRPAASPAPSAAE